MLGTLAAENVCTREGATKRATRDVISTASSLRSSGDTLGPKQILRTLYQSVPDRYLRPLRDLPEIMSKAGLKSESLAIH